jgi:hypothetical protein
MKRVGIDVAELGRSRCVARPSVIRLATIVSVSYVEVSREEAEERCEHEDETEIVKNGHGLEAERGKWKY